MTREGASIELTIRHGEFGQHHRSVAINISEDLRRDLMGRIELSDEPWSLLLASPCLMGGKGDAVTIRRETFKLRREVAKEIAAALVAALVKEFGINDVIDGYRVADMSDEEREYLRRQGRL